MLSVFFFLEFCCDFLKIFFQDYSQSGITHGIPWVVRNDWRNIEKILVEPRAQLRDELLGKSREELRKKPRKNSGDLVDISGSIHMKKY